jgi:predicted transcriptional regulator
MRDRIKTVETIINTTTDTETGEIIDTNVKKIDILINPDDFCLVYSGFWNVLLDYTLSKADVEMFAYLIHNYSDGTPFSITSYTKEEVAKKSKKSITTYNNSTRCLLKNNLIYSVKGKVYKINPKYAFNGSSKNRHKAVIEMLSICKDC